MCVLKNISQSGEILITYSYFYPVSPNINIATCKQIQISVASKLIEDNYIDEPSVNLNYRPDYWHFGIPVNNKGNGQNNKSRFILVTWDITRHVNQ